MYDDTRLLTHAWAIAHKDDLFAHMVRKTKTEAIDEILKVHGLGGFSRDARWKQLKRQGFRAVAVWVETYRKRDGRLDKPARPMPGDLCA